MIKLKYYKIKSDTKGQMMILETIFFMSIVILSLVFLYQLSPSSVVSNTYTYDLKTLGDEALRSITNDIVPISPLPKSYPTGLGAHYLLTNSYISMTSDLNNLLPPNVMYNIYISNETKSEFWCNSIGAWDDGPLTPIDPVTVTHCLVSMDIRFEESAKRAGYYYHIDEDGAWPYTGSPRFRKLGLDDINSWESSDLKQLFLGYEGKVFDIKMEIWYI